MNSRTTTRVTRFIFCLTFSVLFIFIPSYAESPSSGVVIASQKWAEQVARDTVSKIRKGHPRIFLTPERIPVLRTQALSSKAYQFNFIKDRMKGLQAAVLYELGENKAFGLSRSRHEYGRIAAEALMQAIRDGRDSPDNLALLYDWAYGTLTDEERKAFVNFCKSRLGKELRVHNGKHHGYRCSPGPQGLIAALSFYGDGIDDSYAKGLLVQGIRDTLLDNLAMEHVAGKDGGFADGTSYFVQLGGTFYTFLALGIATDSDFFFEHEVIAKLPNHLIYAMLPFPIKRMGSNDVARYFATFHDNHTFTTREFGSEGGAFANMFAITAAEYRRHGDERRAQLYTWFLNQTFGGIPYQAENAISFVLMDWSIQPKSPGELGLPLAEALGWDEGKGQIDRDRFGKKAGIGWVSIRSKWDDPDATFAILKAEPFYYHGHMHHDSLAFMIAKGEELALARAGNYMCWYEGGNLQSQDPGWPQMSNFFWRTIPTNNLLIYNPAENFGEWANDGGQRLVDGWDEKWGRTYNGTADGNYRDIGGLIRFERTKEYVYAAADGTRAYNSTLVTSGNNPKVKLVQREFVYLGSPGGDQDYFVIFDRIESVKPEFKKFWLLQLRAKPEFDGSYKVVVGNDSGGIHLSEGTSSIHVQQERAELSVKVLLPKSGNRLVRRLGGWITTQLRQSLKANDNGPMDIEVESTEGLPEHPVVIITAQPPNPNREVFDRFSVWPQMIHADSRPMGERVCYFCEAKTPPGQRPAKLLKCVRGIKAAPGFAMPVGAKVIQEFRHMGVEGVDKDKDSERIDYPWGYGLGYNYGDGNQYGLWRLEVSPKRASHYDNFLHVLHPSLKREGKMNAELIESEFGNIYGAQIGKKAVIFSRGPEPLMKGSYAISGSAPIWQLLCNLKPERSYQIKQDGKLLLVATASKQGTIQFESAGVNKNSHFEFNEIEEARSK
ncbi:MAG: hypothetical protein ABSG71_06225 [Thermodesulfobacteriota bacterium]